LIFEVIDVLKSLQDVQNQNTINQVEYGFGPDGILLRRTRGVWNKPIMEVYILAAMI